MAAVRDLSGRFKRLASKIRPVKKWQVLIDHDYSGGHFCKGEGSCENDDCHLFNNIKLGKHPELSGWKDGRRIVEFDVLLSNLSSCKSCRLGPIPLTSLNIVGELRKGLSGYLYVKCQNPDCGAVNKAPYGKTHHIKSTQSLSVGHVCKYILHYLDIAKQESLEAQKSMGESICVLGVTPLPDASPSVRYL
ncbi:uncharacterized protein LOC110461074 [Mizuhopecten yessoensis]|uniref:uncharacterized protein LOC110461074 n=1 Tax=Mizuhopecten yessoensis TaxID=6573 RepID=UPI000B45E7A5|nr:uncharacterized protein LOC110461074 [Mizuhopecten yessoensis]